MQILRRLSVLIVISALLGLNLSPARAQEAPVTLNLWMFLDGTGFLESVVAAFEAEHPNIQINITDVPEEEYTTKVDTAFSPAAADMASRSRRAGPRRILPALNDAPAAAGVNLEDYNAGAARGTADRPAATLASYTGAALLFYKRPCLDAAGIPPSATDDVDRQ
jgi:ABC-type glycerol-3-phosphate transport system substrate-binding protein